MKIKRLPNLKVNGRLEVEVGSKIKSAREECGLSQKELGELMGLKSGVAISLWEKNKRNVNAIQLWRIAQITNLPITHFL